MDIFAVFKKCWADNLLWVTFIITIFTVISVLPPMLDPDPSRRRRVLSFHLVVFLSLTQALLQGGIYSLSGMRRLGEKQTPITMSSST